jgi:hypothetical protein
MIRAAHEAGVRRLAMEALEWPGQGTQGPISALPQARGIYLTQPDMQQLVSAALALGWTLWAYEAVFEVTADTDQERFRTMEFTNWREREQAANLGRLLAATPGEPLLVWCGNSHASKHEGGGWVPMGWHFRVVTGIDQFVIDQNVTVAFGSEPQPWAGELLASLGETLAAYGGTAGILRGQAPPPLDCWAGVDAVVVSADNALTGPRHEHPGSDSR